MPLLNILRFTSLDKMFYATFVFLSGESESNYESTLKMLYTMLEKKKISVAYCSLRLLFCEVCMLLVK